MTTAEVMTVALKTEAHRLDAAIEANLKTLGYTINE